MIKTIEEIKAAIQERHHLEKAEDVHLLSATAIIKSDAKDPYLFISRITTDAVDRQKEVVMPGGGNLSEFCKSGAVFWNHDYDQPIGFPRKSLMAQGDKYIDCGARFMERPTDYVGEFKPDFARAFVTQAMKAGVNPGVSIGFVPLESRRPNQKDISMFGQEVEWVHNKWKLLEFSIAPVQANQEAYVVAVGKRLMDRELVTKAGIVVPELIEIPDKPKVARKATTKPKPRKHVTYILPSAPKKSWEPALRHAVRVEMARLCGKVYL